jgi:hypothetical protein
MGGTVLTVRFELGGDCDCGSCGRWLYADGAALCIEQAVSGDEIPQAMRFLEDLYSSTDQGKRARFDDIWVRFEYYSIYGSLEPPRQLRHLEREIWEIKTAEDRVLFYELSECADHKRVVRVTNCAEKSVSKTREGKLPPKHIRRAEAIERIDRNHGAN